MMRFLMRPTALAIVAILTASLCAPCIADPPEFIVSLVTNTPRVGPHDRIRLGMLVYALNDDRIDVVARGILRFTLQRNDGGGWVNMDGWSVATGQAVRRRVSNNYFRDIAPGRLAPGRDYRFRVVVTWECHDPRFPNLPRLSATTGEVTVSIHR